MSQVVAEIGMEEPSKKRQKLKGFEPPPDQVCAMLKGKKTGLSSRNYVASPVRQGVAISRLAEVYLKAGEKLKLHIEKQNLTDKFKETMEEYAGLEPSFKVLVGKGITMKDEQTETTGGIAYGSSAESKAPAEIDDAVNKVYAFLQQPNSRLRSFMGCFFGF